MTTFTNPHERIEQLMLRVEQLEADLALAQTSPDEASALRADNARLRGLLNGGLVYAGMFNPNFCKPAP